MTTTINASPSNGIVQTADGSGVMKLQSNGVTTNALAWVNFNGTGTVAIRSSYNVSSITDNGTGDYTVNFTTAMTDANYSAITTTRYSATASSLQTLISGLVGGSGSTSSVRVVSTSVIGSGSGTLDVDTFNVVIFGN